MVDSERAAALACRSFLDLFSRKADAVVGLATGSSPTEVYRMLAAYSTLGALPDLSRISAFALDEYVGLPREHPESYHSVLTRQWTIPLGLRTEQLHVPLGNVRDANSGSDFEDELLRFGGVDIQLLGIGSNGHIAFNEPGGRLDSRTRVAQLSEQTRRDNARFFASLDEVPSHCVTQGLATILTARRILLLGFGRQKAPAIAAAFEGPVVPELPASILQLHPDVTVFVDEAAASALSRTTCDLSNKSSDVSLGR